MRNNFDVPASDACSGSFVVLLFSLLSLALLCFASAAQSGRFVAFEPHDFAGKTQTTHTFSVLNPAVAYKLRIDNGGANAQFARRVSSGLVKLNGVEVVSPRDFNPNTRRIEKPLTLLQDNTLFVDLNSNADSGITLKVTGEDTDKPGITATVSPSANSADWHNSDATVNFTCTDPSSKITACSAPITVTTEGAGQAVQGTAEDQGGNTATATVTVNLDKTPPTVAITSPADGALLDTSNTPIEATVADSLSGIAAVRCNGEAATLTGSTVHCDVALQEGANALTVQATDNAGHTTASTINVTLSTTPSEIKILEPANFSFFNLNTVTVSGTVAQGTTAVSVNGIPAQVANRRYSVADIPLQLGLNSIQAIATDQVGNSRVGCAPRTLSSACNLFGLVGIINGARCAPYRAS